MATAIRLARLGTKKKAHYRIVVQDDRVKTNGSVIETLGFYNPQVNPPEIKIDQEKVQAWVKKGAQVSAAVKKLITS